MRWLTRSIAREGSIAQFGQVACFGAACLIPVIAFRRLAALEFSEAQLLFGVIATLSLSLNFAILGLLVKPSA